jgi:hypothetical protein
MLPHVCASASCAAVAASAANRISAGRHDGLRLCALMPSDCGLPCLWQQNGPQANPLAKKFAEQSRGYKLSTSFLLPGQPPAP